MPPNMKSLVSGEPGDRLPGKILNMFSSSFKSKKNHVLAAIADANSPDNTPKGALQPEVFRMDLNNIGLGLSSESAHVQHIQSHKHVLLPPPPKDSLVGHEAGFGSRLPSVSVPPSGPKTLAPLHHSWPGNPLGGEISRCQSSEDNSLDALDKMMMAFDTALGRSQHSRAPGMQKVHLAPMNHERTGHVHDDWAGPVPEIQISRRIHDNSMEDDDDVMFKRTGSQAPAYTPEDIQRDAEELVGLVKRAQAAGSVQILRRRSTSTVIPIMNGTHLRLTCKKPVESRARGAGPLQTRVKTQRDRTHSQPAQGLHGTEAVERRVRSDEGAKMR